MTQATVIAAPVMAPRFRVRWKIYLFMFGLGLLAYVQQRGLSVAPTDLPELA